MTATLPVANPFGVDQVNLLVLCSDAGSDQPNAGGYALMAADLQHQALGAVCIPPQTQVKLPDGRLIPMGQAYPVGGARLAAQAAADAVQVPVHQFIRTDISGLEQVIAALDGVDLTLTAGSAPQGLRPGRQHLGAAQAMAYVREPGLDTLSLIQRQQALLVALARQLGDPANARHLPQVTSLLQQNVETTLDAAQWARLMELINQVDCDRLVTVPLPGAEQIRGEQHWFVPSADAATVVSQVREAMCRPPVRPLVTVYNGSDRLGLERLVIQRLEACGYAGVPGGRAPVAQLARSAVRAVDDPAAGAKVAAVLGLSAAVDEPQAYPPAQPDAQDGSARVVVVLGVDYPTP